MAGTIVTLIVLGLVAGALARLLVPGRDSMGILATVALGLAGSFAGGFLGYVLFDKDFGDGAIQPSGVVGSVIGAVVALLVWRTVNRRQPVRR